MKQIIQLSFLTLLHVSHGWTSPNRATIGKITTNVHSSQLQASKSDDIDLDALKKELSEYLEKRKELSADERAKA